MKVLVTLLVYLICNSIFSQKYIIPIELYDNMKTYENRTLCIKSMPSSGNPFLEFPGAILSNINKGKSKSRVYYLDTLQSWKVPIRNTEITSVNLSVDYDPEFMTFHIDSFSLGYKRRRYYKSELSEVTKYFAVGQSSSSDLAYHYLKKFMLPDQKDTLAVRDVYTLLMEDNSYVKYNHVFSEIEELTTDDVFRSIDTIVFHNCYVTYKEEVLIDTSYSNYDHLNIQFLLEIKYDDNKHAMAIETDLLGLVRDVIDAETGIVKYQKTIAWIRKEDLLKYRSDK